MKPKKLSLDQAEQTSGGDVADELGTEDNTARSLALDVAFLGEGSFPNDGDAIIFANAVPLRLIR
jgi:hypothetical protein